jgi:hypothetical protein
MIIAGPSSTALRLSEYALEPCTSPNNAPQRTTTVAWVCATPPLLPSSDKFPQAWDELKIAARELVRKVMILTRLQTSS